MPHLRYQIISMTSNNPLKTSDTNFSHKKRRKPKLKHIKFEEKKLLSHIPFDL